MMDGVGHWNIVQVEVWSCWGNRGSLSLRKTLDLKGTWDGRGRWDNLRKSANWASEYPSNGRKDSIRCVDSIVVIVQQTSLEFIRITQLKIDEERSCLRDLGRIVLDF